MNVHAKILPRFSALALCVISACLLPACGGGSSGGMVQVSPPPPPPPPPPPSGICPETLSADCVVNVPSEPSVQTLAWNGGAQSDYALIKQGGGWLTLNGDFRFSGGTRIEQGDLAVQDVLQSNATVLAGGRLILNGIVRGNVVNQGTLSFGPGYCQPFPCLLPSPARIEGDYRQSASGTMYAVFGGTLQITGRADIEGGTLQLEAPLDWDYGYILPTAPSSQQVLHADGGVFGQFAQWYSQALFIEGNLRYDTHDVYFDLARISLSGAMKAAAAGDTNTLNTAANIDDAFHASDAYAPLPASALTMTQNQFLESAASIQHLRDYGQAVKTFDSLSGHGHVAAVDSLLQQAIASGARSGAHANTLRPGAQGGAWSAQSTTTAASSGTFAHAQTSGYDQWLSDRVVLGSSFGWTQGDLQFDRSGGSARSRSPQWNLYLQRRGDNGSYAMGDVGYGRQQLSLDRRIDLGREVHVARSERHLDVTHAYVEAGREVSLGNGRLTPFAALGYAALRSDGFVEQGDTGFEFIAQPSLHQRVTGDVGLRYARHWRWGGSQWMQLGLGVGYQHLLGESNDMRAAFTGTPEVGFDVNGLPQGRGNGWLEMNLTGGSGDRWSWLLGYDNRASNQTMSLGVELGF